VVPARSSQAPRDPAFLRANELLDFGYRHVTRCARFDFAAMDEEFDGATPRTHQPVIQRTPDSATLRTDPTRPIGAWA